MKKFTFKGVLDGFRSSVQAAPRGTEQEIQETLRPDHFQIKKHLSDGSGVQPLLCKLFARTLALTAGPQRPRRA
ncbi:unnamed protein product [Chrysodeixis includens]|uniref:Uncharacterized protein n=1 Tax=Chrysodeixis includens TaxID=689277 RepID=A0A9N8KTV6_CHRIL|nr:unnamed protein product [Chrysodeixis includens]